MLAELVRNFREKIAGGGCGGGVARAQEDAHEFLSFVLDTLHEELRAAGYRDTSLEGGGGNSEREGGESGSRGGAGVGESNVGGEGEGGSADDAAAGEWEEVGKKNRSAVTRRHKGAPGSGSSAAGSPMAALFGGLLRSTVRAEGHRPSATIEPFFCLSLDVSNGEASLGDALQSFCAPTPLVGYRPGGAGTREVGAEKVVRLEMAPEVLAVHLARFRWSDEGRLGKLVQPVAFPQRLTVGKGTCPTEGPVQYELFATVSHHGDSPDRGHYTADVAQPGGRWARFDDDDVREVTRAEVLAGGGAPYLLWYQRSHRRGPPRAAAAAA